MPVHGTLSGSWPTTSRLTFHAMAAPTSAPRTSTDWHPRVARFTNAYVTCPVCSPSRSALITGMYQTSIGAHAHRSHRTDGYALPEPVRLITDYFRDAGYYTVNDHESGWAVEQDRLQLQARQRIRRHGLAGSRFSPAVLRPSQHFRAASRPENRAMGLYRTNRESHETGDGVSAQVLSAGTISPARTGRAIWTP